MLGRNFKLLFAGRAVSYVGTYLAPIAVAFAVLDLHGSAFAFGGVIWDTTMQRMVAPEKLARVGAYAWMSAMIFLPAGYALAGPIASLVGMRGYLLFGAAWLLVSTTVLARLPSIRGVTSEEVPLPVAVPS